MCLTKPAQPLTPELTRLLARWETATAAVERSIRASLRRAEHQAKGRPHLKRQLEERRTKVQKRIDALKEIRGALNGRKSVYLQGTINEAAFREEILEALATITLHNQESS